MPLLSRGRTLTVLTVAVTAAALITPSWSTAAAAAPEASPRPAVAGTELLPSGAGKAGTLDLTSQGNLDWLHADGAAVETKRSRTDGMTLTPLHPETPTVSLNDSPVAFNWSDGTATPSASGVTTGAVYRYDLSTVGSDLKYAAGYRLTVPAADSARQLVLISGIWQASANFTVTTTSGASVYSTSYSAGSSAAARRTTVTMRPGEGAVVTANLTQVAGRDGNVSFMGAALRSLGDGPALTSSPAPQTLDLTKQGSLDWLHFDGANLDRSAAGNGALGAVNRDSGGAIRQQGDNSTTFSWSNGTPTTSQTGTRTGGVFLARDKDFSKPYGWDLTVAADKNPRTLQFVAGAWQATADLTATFSGSSTSVLHDGGLTAGGSAVNTLYSLNIPGGSGVKISAQLTNTTEDGGNGNVTLAGVTLAQQDFRAALNTLIAQAKAIDSATVEDQIADQLAAEITTAQNIASDGGASASALQEETFLLGAAVNAAAVSANNSQYTYQSHPGLTSSFGWEGDKDAPIAFIDGGYRLRDHDNTMVNFGVPDIPGKIKWYNAEGYLPAFVSEYSKAGLDITVQSFADEATVGGNRYEIAYSRMTVHNTTTSAASLPRVSTALIPLNADARATTVAAGATVTRDYAIGADRFGGTYAWPTNDQITALGSYDTHYSHMRDYWNNRLSKVANITDLPDPSLINAYKAGYIYTLIIRDDVNGQKQLHVGENGYDEMFDHDTIGIVSNLLNMGDFTYAQDYLATLPAQLQYQDAKWKYSVPYAMYMQRTGDKTFVRDHFDVIKKNTHTISTDREDGGTGIMKITNAIDSDGHWTVDNWSALYGLSTYRYVAQQLGDDTEAAWAMAEYQSLLKAANAKLDATRASLGLNYMPMAMDQANETGPRSDPRDANWASMFLFGGWAWDGYLYGMPQSGTMLDSIDQTYTYGIDRRKGVSDSPYNFGGYPHGYYSSAYNAGYGGAALRGEEYRDIGIKAYEFMIEHSQSGPFGWWEGVDYPNANSPWNIDHAAGGGGSDQHMWGQAMGTKVLFDSLISLKSDGDVIIGRGIPADWSANGKKVALTDFPVSDGGRLGYSMTASKRSITVELTGDVAKVPNASVQLLALKNNIKSVDVPGAKVDNAAGTVTLPHGTTKVTIQVGEGTTLDAAIEQAKSLNAADYTKSTWASVQSALQQAEATAGDANATDEQVAAAASSLTAAIDALIHVAPTAETVPTITGTPRPGNTLHATPGTWSTTGLTFTYEWLRDGDPITGNGQTASKDSTQSGDSFAVTDADLGSRISVRVTASKSGFEDGVATSEPVLVTADAATIPGTGSPSTNDPAQAGTTGPAGVLAFTGSDTVVPLALLALLLLGAGGVFLARRRRTFSSVPSHDEGAAE